MQETTRMPRQDLDPYPEKGNKVVQDNRSKRHFAASSFRFGAAPLAWRLQPDTTDQDKIIIKAAAMWSAFIRGARNIIHLDEAPAEYELAGYVKQHTASVLIMPSVGLKKSTTEQNN